MERPAHLLSVGDLTCIALVELLEAARQMKADATGFTGALEGQTLACFFDPPTSGATLSGAVAAHRLGMHPLMLPRRELVVGSGEPLGDIARSFSAAAAATENVRAMSPSGSPLPSSSSRRGNVSGSIPRRSAATAAESVAPVVGGSKKHASVSPGSVSEKPVVSAFMPSARSSSSPSAMQVRSLTESRCGGQCEITGRSLPRAYMDLVDRPSGR